MCERIGAQTRRLLSFELRSSPRQHENKTLGPPWSAGGLAGLKRPVYELDDLLTSAEPRSVMETNMDA